MTESNEDLERIDPEDVPGGATVLQGGEVVTKDGDEYRLLWSDYQDYLSEEDQ